MDQIEPAGAPPFIEPALIEPAQIGPAPPVPCPIDPSSIVPAYRLARLGFVLVPLVTGILVAVPLAVLCWALFAGYGIGLTLFPKSLASADDYCAVIACCELREVRSKQ